MTDPVAPASAEDVERIKALAIGQMEMLPVVITFPPDSDKLIEWLDAAAPIHVLSLIAWGEAAERRLRNVAQVIPINFLQRHDAPGASGPTHKLDLASAVDEMVRMARKWEDRARVAESRAAEAEAQVRMMAGALREYLYETTHLATPETVGGREYRKTLVPYSAIKSAQAALSTPPAAVALAEREVIEAAMKRAACFMTWLEFSDDPDISASKKAQNVERLVAANKHEVAACERLLAARAAKDEGSGGEDICSFPDCGCAEARLCPAPGGANRAALHWNLPKRPAPTPAILRNFGATVGENPDHA